MQPLEKIVERSRISKKIEVYTQKTKEFYQNYSSIMPGITHQDILDIKKQHEILKKKVIQKLVDKKEEYADLYDKKREYTDNRIKKRDIRVLYEYVLAKMVLDGDPNKIKNSIFSKNYCNRCGMCCTVTEDIGIRPDEYKRMIKVKPELAKDIINSRGGMYKFKKEKPCKFFNKDLKKCEIYDLRPNSCREYPCPGGRIVYAGDCEYVVQYMFEECKNLFIKCLQK